MPRLHDVRRAGISAHRGLHRARPVGGGNAGRHPFLRLDRGGDGGLVAGAVVAAHQLEAELEGFIAPKGSIALDGVSLTVNEVEPVSEGVRFALNIIPHTAAQTSLAGIAAGRRLNIEIDILARYLGRMLEARNATV